MTFDRPNASTATKASDLLIAALEAEGVEYIFAVPGEENLDVLESREHLLSNWF